MKITVLSFLFSLSLAVAVFPQTAISDLEPTPQPTPEIKADLLAVNVPTEKAVIETAPYELKGFAAAQQNKLSYSGERLRLLQPGYVPRNGAKSYLTIGANNRRIWPAALNLTAFEIRLPLTISGANKSYYGQRINLDLQGTPTNPIIIGKTVFIESNGLSAGGTGSISAITGAVDVGGPVGIARGASFSAFAGNTGASGTTTIQGIDVLAVGGYTTIPNLIGADIQVSTTVAAGTVTNPYVLRLRARAQSGHTFSNLRFISMSDSIASAGTITTSYGLYADTSIDLGATRYFIYSTSTSPSFFTAPINFDATITVGGMVGNQTINKPQGTVNFAAAATAITVTNSYVTANSIVLPIARTNDATCSVKNIVSSAGSFVINMTAGCTAETSVGFVVH